MSAGATEGHSEGKTLRCGKVTKWVLFLQDNAPADRALTTQKELAYRGFHCLDHTPYSPGLAPSHYHLFPGLKKPIESSLIFARSGGYSFHGDPVGRTILCVVLCGLQKLEQRAKKCIEHRGECVE